MKAILSIWFLFITGLYSVSFGQSADTLNTVGTNFPFDTETNGSNNQMPENWREDQEKGEEFFDSLKAKANQKNWSKQLHRLLVIDSREETDGASQNGYDRTNYFAQFKGKQIRNIEIKQLDVFGPSVTDTVTRNKNWTQKLGNSLHISTHKSALKTYLFFEEGEMIDPYLLSDNERIFRTIPNIQDARIYIVPVEGNPDLVDVQIVTKDVWPIGVGLEVFDYLYGNVSLWSNNMLGMGHQLKYTAYYNSDTRLDRNYGYKAEYRIPNIGNTFTTLELKHEDTWNQLTTRVHLSRNFIVPSMLFGGGIGYEKNFYISDFPTLDTVYKAVKSDHEYYDIWGGYSIPIRTIENQKLRKTFFATARGSLIKYLLRPEVDEKSLYHFHNRQLMLASLGFAWQGYHSTRLVYGFGNTEDLPLGAMIKFTGGVESSEFTNRFYYGASFTLSKHIQNIGYLVNSFEYGSFHNGSPEQGAFKYKLHHISPRVGGERHSFRHITEIGYNQGYNRFEDEYVSIFEEQNTRGLNYLPIRGDKGLYANSEVVYYSPQYLYGFRFVYFLFLDFKTVNAEVPTLIDNPIYSRFGVGVRIRNERLVFNTIQIRLHFIPPNSDLPGMSKDIIEFTGFPAEQIPEFANRKPEIIKY